MNFNRLKWLYLIGFFLILALPLLSLPPWFSPPDWGKTIVFRIILSILIFIFLWQILNDREPFSAKFSKRVKMGLFLLLALFGIFLLATIFSLDTHFSLWGSPYRSGGFLNFAFYIIFAILTFLILRKSDWQKIWDFAIFIGISVSIIAILQWQGLFKGIFITYEARPPSTVGGPIFLAIYLLLLSFLALSFGIKTKIIFKKIFYFLSLFLFVFVILLTYTRAAFLGLFVGILYFLLFYPKKLIWLKVFALIFLILGIYGVYYLNTQSKLPEFVKENKILKGVISRLSIKAALKDPRISGWKVSWEALKDRPILGYGPENFSMGFDKYYDAALPGIEKPPPGGVVSWWDRAHNFVFDIGVTVGIPTLIIYLSLFAILFLGLQKIKKKQSDDSLVCHGIQATFIGYLVANFFSFDTFSSYLISFLLIAYSLSLLSEQNTNKETTDREHGFMPIKRIYADNILKWRWVIILLLFIGLVWFIWVFNLKPFKINTQINLAGSLVENERCDLALKKMEEILPQKSFLDAFLRLEYVDILIKCKEQMPEASLELVKRATKVLREGVRARPYFIKNYITLGSLINFWVEHETNPEIAQSLKTEANSYFEMAHKLSPKRQEVFVEWIKNDLITGEYQKAKTNAQKCIDLNPRLGDCWWLTGLSNIYLGEEEAAKENIEMAGKRGYPVRSENSLLKLAKVYVETGNYQKLIEIYQQLIKIKPANPEYYASLAIVYREVGDFENARKEIQKALELAPELKEAVEEFLETLK